MKALSRMSSRSRQFLNFGVTFVSVMLCILILPYSAAGNGIAGNWAQLAVNLVGCLEY
jgi:hypothetical protein